jgi:hypothetical protein
MDHHIFFDVINPLRGFHLYFEKYSEIERDLDGVELA